MKTCDRCGKEMRFLWHNGQAKLWCEACKKAESVHIEMMGKR